MENQRAVQASPDRPLELGHDDVGWTRRRQRLVEFRPAYSEGEPCVHPGRVYGGGLGGASNLVEKAAHLYGVPVITQPLGTRLWAPWSTGRIALFAVAAGLPVLSISAHVFGVMAIHWAALHVVLPTLLVALVLVLAGVPEATVVKKGAAAGLIAVAAYDCTRLPFVLLGLWHDFIPRVGGWVAVDEGPPTLHAVLGYTWRYFGNGMGIGVFFFIACAVLRVRRHFVAIAVAYAVFVWSGLMATVVLATHGQKLLFAITPLSVSVSLAGHLVYGLVLGLVKDRFERRDAAAASSSPPVRTGGRHRLRKHSAWRPGVAPGPVDLLP